MTSGVRRSQKEQMGGRLADDREEGDGGDEKGKSGVEQEVDRARATDGIDYEGVEGSADAIEAGGEGESQRAVDREIANAQHEADCVEPADAASCKQAQEEYLKPLNNKELTRFQSKRKIIEYCK